MAKTSQNIRPDASPAYAIPGTNPVEDKLPPVPFANVEALLASRPVTQGNQQERTVSVAYNAGRDAVGSMFAAYHSYSGQPLPVETDRQEMAMKRSRDILLDRVIGAMCGNYGYALAYADAAAMRARAHAQTEESDKDGPAGWESRLMQLMETAQERDATAAWLCDMIHGATEAYSELTGERFKLYQAPDKTKTAERLKDARGQVAERLAAFLAKRDR